MEGYCSSILGVCASLNISMSVFYPNTDVAYVAVLLNYVFVTALLTFAVLGFISKIEALTEEGPVKRNGAVYAGLVCLFAALVLVTNILSCSYLAKTIDVINSVNGRNVQVSFGYAGTICLLVFAVVNFVVSLVSLNILKPKTN